MRVPDDAAIKKALRTWRAVRVRPDGGIAVLQHLLTLPDGRKCWASGYVLEVTDTPDPRLRISTEPPVYSNLPKLSADLEKLISRAPKSNPLSVVSLGYEGRFDTIELVGKSGHYRSVQRDFVAYFQSRYPDAEWLAGHKVNGIRVRVGTETVGIVMPLAGR